MELEVDGVMIWSIQEAQEISINQIGRSACGATACLNVLVRWIKINNTFC